MDKPFVPRVGGVLSADIAVPEIERERRFYTRVLGTGEKPLWGDDLLNNRGMPVIGLGERVPEHAELPLQWMPHMQVADVASSARRALELGGRELMHGRDGDGASQWAVLLDPDGAAFGLIPVVSPEALPAVDVAEGVGRIVWLDLTVADAHSTREFYREVVGWSVQDVAMSDEAGSYADYCMTGADGSALAGVCHARGPNRDLPPVWLIYLPVGDLAESLRRVRQEGGRVLRAPADPGSADAFAVIEDPVGATLALAPGS